MKWIIIQFNNFVWFLLLDYISTNISASLAKLACWPNNVAIVICC